MLGARGILVVSPAWCGASFPSRDALTSRSHPVAYHHGRGAAAAPTASAALPIFSRNSASSASSARAEVGPLTDGHRSADSLLVRFAAWISKSAAAREGVRALQEATCASQRPSRRP